jgi:UDP-N-acetyl-D-mannosaminuronate dehydrogenase
MVAISANSALKVDPQSSESTFHSLEQRIAARRAHVVVVGLGYVGLPLSMACADAGFPVTGQDIDPEKVIALRAGNSYIDAVSSQELASQMAEGGFTATNDHGGLANADVSIICVSTPLSRNRESVPLDAVLIATDHDAIDFELVSKHARIVVDTRNAMERRGLRSPSFIRACPLIPQCPKAE